jgi:hypothetical protein
MLPAASGRCTVCGAPLADGSGEYWITAHPDGVHHHCRAWHTEPFPFGGDLERLRRVALVARHAWREIVRDGRFLAAAERRWPAAAHRIASEWLERKRRLQHHLDRLRDQLRL